MTDIKQQTAEVASTVAGKVSIATGSGVAVFSGLTVQEWGVVIGLAIALLSWLTQLGMGWYFNYQRLKLERERIERQAFVENSQG